MSDFIIGLSQVMRAEVDALNAIAQNSANVNTAGYKSIRSTRSPDFETNLANGLAPNIATKVSTTRGKISITEQPLDFAIMGNGWFGVQHNEEVVLTRNGNFRLNENNVLTTQDGHPVLGLDGEIVLSSDSVHVDAEGNLSTAEGERYRFAVYTIGNDSDITPIGNGLYASTTTSLSSEPTKVLQGALEESNVDSAADMVRLMEVTRHIESVQRAINTYNELLNTGINEIGK